MATRSWSATACCSEDTADIPNAIYRISPWSSFVRGECNNDGGVNVADALCSLNWLFSDGTAAGCTAALNTNGDAAVNIADPIALLTFLFAGGLPPGTPFPECGGGPLPTDRALGCWNPPRACEQ